MKNLKFLAAVTLLVSGISLSAVAAPPEYQLTIKDHRFEPDVLRIPAGTKIKLRVHNADPTAEEFESNDFNREKIIGGGKTATIFVGPLKAGEYKFFGEFNLDTAQGVLIAE